VYVVPVSNGATVRVSANGGTTARWSRDGRELFYLAADGHLVALPVRTQPSLVLGTPVRLFVASAIKQRRDQEEFDVSPDGRRFIAVVPSPQPAIALVLHALAGAPR
jgi:Tol biopolymer transport system component